MHAIQNNTIRVRELTFTSVLRHSLWVWNRSWSLFALALQVDGGRFMGRVRASGEDLRPLQRVQYIGFDRKKRGLRKNGLP